MPRTTPRRRPVFVTDASIAGGPNKKPPEKSLAESERRRHIHRLPKTNAVSAMSRKNASQIAVKPVPHGVWCGFTNERAHSARWTARLLPVKTPRSGANGVSAARGRAQGEAGGNAAHELRRRPPLRMDRAWTLVGRRTGGDEAADARQLRSMNVPSRSSSIACRICSFVFITIGPYQATGSSIGWPDTSRKRIPCSPA